MLTEQQKFNFKKQVDTNPHLFSFFCKRFNITEEQGRNILKEIPNKKSPIQTVYLNQISDKIYIAQNRIKTYISCRDMMIVIDLERMTQAEVAEKYNISRQYVSHIMNKYIDEELIDLPPGMPSPGM
jgi:CRP-like cAMP-binding protein